jgi:ferritin-like metal-binding protein YciE
LKRSALSAKPQRGTPRLSTGGHLHDDTRLLIRQQGHLTHSSKIVFIGGKMSDQGLKELYIDELKDLYNAENQLVKALPKMAKAASSDELRQGFEEHLEQTRGQVQRLEKIFQALGESPKGRKCKGMEGLIEEGSEAMKEDYEGSVLDAALIGAAQRVEHYEIAGYGTVRSMADTLGESDHVSLIEETLEEEKQTDKKLSELAAQINSTANEREEDEAMREQAKKSKRVA